MKKLIRGRSLVRRLGQGPQGSLAALEDPREPLELLLIGPPGGAFESLGFARVAEGPGTGQDIYAAKLPADRVRMDLPKYESAGAVVIDLDHPIRLVPPESTPARALRPIDQAPLKLVSLLGERKATLGVCFIDDKLLEPAIVGRHAKFGGYLNETRAPGRHAPWVAETALATLNYSPQVLVFGFDAFDGRPSTKTSTVIAGIAAAIKDPRILVLNLSLSGPPNDAYDWVAGEAKKKGVLLVAAAGNHGGEVESPARNGHVAVGSIDPTLSRMSRFSAKASLADLQFLSEAGEDIWIEVLGEGRQCLSGTSFSSPRAAIVLGALQAILISAGYSRAEAAPLALKILFAAARPLGEPDGCRPRFSVGQGHGRLREVHLLHFLQEAIEGAPRGDVATVEAETGWSVPALTTVDQAATTLNALRWGMLGPVVRRWVPGPVTASMIRLVFRSLLLIELRPFEGSIALLDPRTNTFLKVSWDKSWVAPNEADARISDATVLSELRAHAEPFRSQMPEGIGRQLSRWWAGRRLSVRPVCYPVYRVMATAPAPWGSLEIDAFTGALLTCEECRMKLRKLARLA